MLNIIAGTLSVGVTPSTNSYESIATSTVGSGGTSTITFSSIPSTYEHLQIRALSKNDRSTDTEATYVLKFNSDSTSANYRSHRLIGDGSSASASDIGNQSGIYVYASSTSNNSLNNIFGASVWDILDYKNTNKYKTVRALGGNDINGSGGRITLASGLWMSTAAVNNITLTLDGGFNFTQYSSFALYGIKGV